MTRILNILSSWSDADKARLGIPEKVTYRHVNRLFITIVKHIESGASSDLTTQSIMDCMLDDSVPPALRDHPHYALDWTNIEAWARPTTESHDSADRDAKWGWRSPKNPHSPPKDARPDRGSRRDDEFYFGYRLQALTMVRPDGGPDVPELVRRITFSHAKADQPRLSLGMLQRILDSGGTRGDVLADAEYMNSNDWTTTLHALGFAPVMDVNPQYLGPQGTYEGALLVDDQLLCPCTPKKFLELGRPNRRSRDDDEWSRYFNDLDERQRYAFHTHGSRRVEGGQRMRCPAERKAVRCGLKEEKSRSAPAEAPKILKPPDRPPKVCAQSTITVPPHVLGKIRQKHAYFSQEWIESYNRRTAVERSFSRIKDKACIDLDRGSLRVMGEAKLSFMYAIGVAAMNYRVMSSFAAATSESMAARRSTRRAYFSELRRRARDAA
jgi:hypothetical protein